MLSLAPIPRRLLAAATLFAALAATPSAQADCTSPTDVNLGVTTGLAAGFGIGAAVGSSALISELDDTRDYSFTTGALVGAGVSAGLALVFLGVEIASDCELTEDEGSVVWSVPIVTFAIGAILPLAVWGASDEVGEATAALAGDPPRPSGASASLFQIEF